MATTVRVTNLGPKRIFVLPATEMEPDDVMYDKTPVDILGAMAQQGFTDDLSGRHIERGEQRRGPVEN